MLLTIILWFFLSIVAAAIASNKGNSGIVCFLGSIFFSPLIGLLVAIVSKPNRKVLEKYSIQQGHAKRCPECFELIQAKAKVCHYCNAVCVVPEKPVRKIEAV
jgi:hypothetical protein